MNSRKNIIRAICILSAAAVMAGAFTACGKKSDGITSDGETSSSENGENTGGNSSDSVSKLVKLDYDCEEIKLPEELKDGGFEGFHVSGNGFYTVVSESDYDEETDISSITSYICNVDNDGNLVSRTDITPVPEADGDTPVYQEIVFLNDGSLLLFERHNLPSASAAGENDTDDTDREDIGAYEDYEIKTYIVVMSADGTVISRKDAADIPGLSEITSDMNSYIDGVLSNDKGEIAISYQKCDENWNYIPGVIVLDKDMNKIFEKELPSDGNSWINGSFTGGDGSFNYILYSYDMSSGGMPSQKLYRPDLGTGELVEVSDWTADSSGNMITGSGDYLAYYYDSSSASVEGMKNDGTSETIVNLLNNGLFIEQVSGMFAEGDDLYIVGYENEPIIYKLRKLDDSEVKEKEQVTLASYYADSGLQSAVAAYNRSDGNYLITVTDYSKYDDYSSDDEEAWNAGITKLNSEISSGQIPDIISIADPEMLASFSAKGLFVDLNTYIDGEDGLDRSEYFDNVFRAMETDGKLYAITGSVGILGTCAKQSYIPEDGPVSWETADSILSQHSGMKLLPNTLTREDFMTIILSCGYKNFVDISAGECRLDSPEFVEILERSANYPEEIDYNELNSDPDYWNNFNMQYRNDQTLLCELYLYSFDSYYYTADGSMGEDISILGMPGSGSGACIFPSCYISISAESAHPDAGWELIKSMLSYDEDRYSVNNGFSYFPLNKQSYQKMGEAVIESTYYTDSEGNRVQNEQTYYIDDTQSVTLRNVDQALIDRISGFISSTDNVYMGTESGILDIIREESAAFYAGTSTAQQAADNIQSRVSLYLSEHN